MWLNDTTYITHLTLDDVRKLTKRPNLAPGVCKGIINQYVKLLEERQAEDMRVCYKKTRRNAVENAEWTPAGYHNSRVRAADLGSRYPSSLRHCWLKSDSLSGALQQKERRKPTNEIL